MVNMFTLDQVPPLPKRIDLEPTIRCNFKCTICQRTYWQRKAPDMSLTQFQQVIRQFPDLTRLKIQGMGEPLLNQAFFDMVRYAKALGIDEVSTFTNGALLDWNQNARQLVESGIDLVRISIDSAEKESFERIRPGARFQDVIQGAELLNNIALKHQHPAVEIWTVVTQENRHQLSAIIDLAKALNIQTLHFQIIMNTFDYKDAIQDQLKPLKIEQDRMKSKIDAALQYAASQSITLLIQKSKSHSPQNPCHWPFDSAYITTDGYVVPCCTIADPDVINMGNVFEEPFESIWSNARYQAFRESILSHQLFKACRNCYTALKQ